MENGYTHGNIDEQDVVSYANDLLTRCQIDFSVEDLSECTSDLFLAFYHAILGDFPTGALTECSSVEAQIHNVKCVVETLSEDYLKVDLSHISPEEVVRGDLLSLYNLIEIFDGLLDYLLEKIGVESTDSGDEGDIDSDQLSENAKAMALETIQKEISRLNSSGLEPSLSSTAELIALGRTAIEGMQEKDFTPLRPDISLTLETSTTSHRQDLSDHTLHATTELAIKTEAIKTEFSGVTSDVDSYESLPKDISTISTKLSQLKMDLPEREKAIAEERQKFDPRSPSPPGAGILVSDSGRSLDSEGSRRALNVELDDGCTSFLLKKKEHIKPGQESSASESVDVADGGRRDFDESDEEKRCRDVRSRPPPTPKKKDWQMMLDNLQKTVEESKKIRQDYFSSPRLRLDPAASSDDLMARCADETGTTDETLDDTEALQHHTRRRKNVRFEDTISTKTAKELLQFRQLLEQEKTLQEEKNKILSRNFRGHFDEVRDAEREKLDPLRRKVTQSEKKVKDAVQQQKKPKGKSRSTRKRNITDVAKWKGWLSPTKVRPQLSRSLKTTPKRATSTSMSGSIDSINEYDLLPKLLEEFPQLELPATTLNDMWQKQFRQIEHLTKASFDHKNKKRKSEMQLHQAHLRHELLTNIMQKDHEHTRHLRDVKERVVQQKEAQRILRDRRLQTARIRKYYKDYQLQMRSRMTKRRTKEERIFKRLFEDGLAIQRARLRELRKYARDKRDEQQKRQVDEIQSLENYYKDQFNILAETLSTEKDELKVRDQAQMKVISQMKRGLRQKMEKEIGNLQEMIARDDEDAFFREIEADRLRGQLQLATYHAQFHE